MRVVEHLVGDAQMQLAWKEGWANTIVFAAVFHVAVDRANGAGASSFGLRDNGLEVIGERLAKMRDCFRGGSRETTPRPSADAKSGRWCGKDIRTAYSLIIFPKTSSPA